MSSESWAKSTKLVQVEAGIIELAEFYVDPERVDEFLGVVGDALALIKGAAGCRDAKVYQVHEREGVVVLLAHWDTISSHLDRFRASDSYLNWRAAISPYFVQDPSVVHLIRSRI